MSKVPSGETIEFTISIPTNGPPEPCVIDSDCPPEKPYCSFGVCVECLQDVHCPSGKVCRDGVCVDEAPPDDGLPWWSSTFPNLYELYLRLKEKVT